MFHINLLLCKKQFFFLAIVFCILSFLCSATKAQNNQFKFERITVSEGLSDNRVLCMTRDKFGYMWFGTENGLNCYDGYEIKFWRWRKNDSTAILNSRVAALVADSSGTIWASSESGISRLDFADRRRGQFRNYPREFVGNLFETESSTIWTHDKTHILKFDKMSGAYSPVMNGTAAADGHLRWFHRDDAGDFWLTTTKSLYHFNPGRVIDLENMAFERYPLPQRLNAKFSFLEEIISPRSNPNSLWLQTHITWPPENSSWLQFDKTQKLFSPIAKNLLLPEDLQTQYISLLWQDINQDLWIGLQEKGLYYLPATGQGGRLFRGSLSDRDRLSNDKISCIYRDRGGILWIGTSGGGVNKLKSPEMSFELYRKDLHDSTSLVENTVWTFFEDSRGVMWIGAGSSLLQMLPGNNGKTQFSEFINFSQNHEEMQSSQIRAIVEERPGILWLALTNPWQEKLHRLLARFDVEKREISFPVHHPHTGSIYCMTIDKKQQIWLGTNGTGLVKIDRSKQVRQQYFFNTRGNFKGNHWVTAMLSSNRDGQEIFWLGTFHHGLVKFDPEKETCTYFQNDPHDPASLPTNGILSLHEETNGTLWIGTRGFGLVRMDELANNHARFTKFSTADGLPDNVIYGIVQDDAGILWLSTDRGLCRFNPKLTKFKNYNRSDGLQDDEFNLGASFKDSRGRLYFGGNYGFNRFLPADFTDPIPPQVMLTKFRKFGREVDLGKPVSELAEITLHSSDDFFGFEFVALHFKDPKRNEYAYKLEGFDKDWVHIGNKREANYTNLDPGNYTFRVKAANRDCIWNEKGASIKIHILPVFWQTTPFLIFSMVALAIIFGSLHLLRVRLKVRQALAVEKEKEKIQQQIMADFHDELGGRISKISRLSKFAGAGLDSKKLDRERTLREIARNADRLYKEHKEMLWELDPSKSSLADLVDQLKSYSEELFDSTDIAFQLRGDFEKWESIKLPQAWRQQLLRIFKEGMHNIFKHADGCENVVLKVQINDANLEIRLEDDGVGFDKEASFSGNGLKSMVVRAAEIGAEFEILQKNDHGTILFLRGKLS